MSESTPSITVTSTMRDVLQAYPGAQRALFHKYHIGGCSSCGFQPEETLGALCARNNNLDVPEVLAHIQSSHDEDARILVSPEELARMLQSEPAPKLLDVRAREEFEAVRIEGSRLLSQDTMQEIMGHWSREEAFVILDHHGKTALDAAAYFLGHGFTHVRCLRGGLDAWSRTIDPKVPRYKLEATKNS